MIFTISLWLSKTPVRVLRFNDLDLVINGLSAMLCRKLKSLRDIFFMYDLFGKFQIIYGVSRNVWKCILKLWKK